jgi:hypothetical protein
VLVRREVVALADEVDELKDERASGDDALSSVDGERTKSI